MKKTALSLALIAASGMAQADTIFGLDAGFSQWSPEYSGPIGNNDNTVSLEELGYTEEDHNVAYIAIEHPIPVLPNIKLQTTELDSIATGTISQSFEIGDQTYSASATLDTSIDLSHTDATFYYELLDNWVSLDLGLTVRNFDGEVTATDGITPEREELDELVPMLYAMSKFELPLTGLSISAGGNIISYGGNSLSDLEAKISYTFDLPALDVSLDAGYRTFAIELDDIGDLKTDLEFSGSFIGANIHF